MTVPFVLVLVAIASVGGAVRAERTAGDLRLEMSVARGVFQVGEPVHISLRVSNISGTPVTLTSGGQQYDVIVRQRGALVWQWSHDKGFAQVVRSVEMAPGDARTYKASWDQRDLQGRPVEPGTYEVSCVLLAAQRSGPASVEVGPVRITIAR
ncbi:MAG: BsuPI-related putative proteinase inhibitor [Armatimonadota bacterium]|nr:BsuPI-related putative proteinase inhibitor [Armatimonadota bacterium]